MELPLEFSLQILQFKDEKTKIEKIEAEMQIKTNQSDCIDYRDKIYENSLEFSKINSEKKVKIEPFQIQPSHFHFCNNLPQPEQDINFNSNHNIQFFQIQKKRRKQRYLRSTNNSHKKFISSLRRLFFSVISNKQKEEFQERFKKSQSSRAFFFIILAYMKYRFSKKLINSVQHSFIKQMKTKISQYQDEISKTKWLNLKNFRNQEVVDIRYSIYACQQYFLGNTQQAIESMYKKDKSTVIKRQHYEAALKQIEMIEKQLEKEERQKISQPYVQEDVQNSQRQKMFKKVLKRQIRQKHVWSSEQNLKNNQIDKYKKNNPFQENFSKMKGSNVKNEFCMNKNLQLSAVQKKIEKNIYPPLMQFIPYIPYDPFIPPHFAAKGFRPDYDIKQDFFGFMKHGFKNIYCNFHD